MTTNPLSQLATVEANLTAAINAAADQIDTLGTSAVAAALARLQASAEAAQVRLTAAVAGLTSIVGGVVDAFATQTNGILAALALNVVPTIPAQIAASIPPVVEPSPAPVKTMPPFVRDVINTIACDVPSADAQQNAQEANQSVPAVETTQTPVEPASEAHVTQEQASVAVVTTAANPPAETPDQVMARVLLPHHEPKLSTPTTKSTSKRKPRGKAGAADAGSIAGT